MASSPAPEPEPEPQPAARPAPPPLFSLPSEVALLDHLRRWVQDGSIPSWIRVVDVYAHDPSELMLPATATTAADGGVAWYCFTSLRHLRPFDHRIKHNTAAGGTWRIEHHRPLASEPGAVHLGTKTSLSHILKNAHGLAERTGHLMREYVLAGDAGLFPGDGLLPGGEKALCQLYNTPRGEDAASRALQKTLDQIKMADDKRSKKQHTMAAARAAKAEARLASREATKASKAKHRASLMAAAAAALQLASATPTAAPSATPTVAPSATPTAAPSATPMAAPSSTPTAAPSATPTAVPSATPTAAPSATPTAAPSATPTAAPSATPTAAPSATTTAVKGKKPAAVKGKKPAAAKGVDMATVSAAVALAVGVPRIALLTPDALSPQLKKKDLASTSSAAAKAPSPPKRRLLLQVGVQDNIVYDAQEVYDSPPLMKARPVDCSGWIILDTRTKDKVTGGHCTAA